MAKCVKRYAVKLKMHPKYTLALISCAEKVNMWQSLMRFFFSNK